MEEDNETLGVAITREDLANIVGTATETVIRFLSEIKRDKMNDLKGRKIRILNHKALLQTANVYD
ncbi:MAG: helix-turn-helix domain-containing protein [Methanobacteriota archaeon]|nr:MAG: helix-turn-helix domain-containing protein [Euryarchaeota archaeon]